MRDQDDFAVSWLLQEDQPSIRYQTLIDLIGLKENDPIVKKARGEIPSRGWASEIFKKQKAGGFWESRGDLYIPKYTATNWRAIVLSDLGLTSEDMRIKKTADLFFEEWLDPTSEFNVFKDEVCIVGNTARMLARFGYLDDHRVKKLYDRLLDDQKEDGGWHCFKSDRGTLDCWEGLAAFAAIPRQRQTRRIKNSIERGAEFYLERRLLREGSRKYAPWFRFHYPNHYYYDVLVGLDLMTKLGYASDKRLAPALEIMKKKRQKDGTWLLDHPHPDLAPRANYALRREVKAFSLERANRPSKWITLNALRVLKRVEAAS